MLGDTGRRVLAIRHARGREQRTRHDAPPIGQLHVLVPRVHGEAGYVEILADEAAPAPETLALA